MIMDALARFSDAQAVTEADAYGTDVYDLGATVPVRQIGTGEPMAVVFTIDVAAAGVAGGGSPFTDQNDFIVVQSANANLSSHTEVAKRRVASADLVAGAQIVIPIPPGMPTARYLGVRYELGAHDTVSVSAALVPQSHAAVQQYYASGYQS